MAEKTTLTTDNVTLDKIAKHFIELQQVTSSGDTLEFNSDWARDSDIYYVNVNSKKLPMNKGIPNGKSFGQGINPATGSASAGFDKVYAEIDAFKIDGQGNYVVDVFPADKLALENAFRLADPQLRKSTMQKITLHQMPVAYLTDHFVPEKNSDGSVKKDGNGNPVYQVSSVTPLTVVYRSKTNYHDPYNETPDWYRKTVQASGSSATQANGVKVADRSKALALIEGLDYYLRGIDFVSYDYYTPSSMEIIASLADESSNKIVPSTQGLDGIPLDNAKLATLLPDGVMSSQDIPSSGQPTNNEETGEDAQVVESEKGPVFTNDVERKEREIKNDLGMTGNQPQTAQSAPKQSATKPASAPKKSTTKSAPKSAPKTSSKTTTKTSNSKSSKSNKSSK